MSAQECVRLTKICVSGTNRECTISMPFTFNEFSKEVKSLSGLNGNEVTYKIDGRNVNLSQDYSMIIGYPNLIHVEPKEKQRYVFETVLISIILAFCLFSYILEWILPEIACIV